MFWGSIWGLNMFKSTFHDIYWYFIAKIKSNYWLNLVIDHIKAIKSHCLLVKSPYSHPISASFGWTIHWFRRSSACGDAFAGGRWQLQGLSPFDAAQVGADLSSPSICLYLEIHKTSYLPSLWEFTSSSPVFKALFLVRRLLPVNLFVDRLRSGKAPFKTMVPDVSCRSFFPVPWT